MKLFRSTPAAAPEPKPQERLSRRSTAMAEIARTLKTEDTLCVLDIGATSASNIRFFTERGHRIYSQDLLEASTDPYTDFLANFADGIHWPSDGETDALTHDQHFAHIISREEEFD